ncbi:MAG: hypothetical protein GY950_11800, partial [bacterium]|nr:hypothetical protein [bacterium]
PYERGLQHGTMLKKEIGELVAKWKKDLKHQYKVNADEYIKKFLKNTNFKPAIKKWTPGLLEEVKGIAKGSGIDFNTMYAFQLLDEQWLHGKSVLHHCTGIGVNRQGKLPAMAAQNLDIPEFFDGYQALFHIKDPGSKLETFVVAFAGIVAGNGMNNSPVSVHVNAITQMEFAKEGLPVAFVIRGALQQTSYEKAVEFIHTIKHASGQNYIITGLDKSSGFECSAKKVSRYIPFEGAQWTYHTNHPRVNDNYSPKYLAYLKRKGKTIDQVLYRCDRFDSLEKRFKNRTKPVTFEDIKEALSSRDTGRWDICNKTTFACTIMVLSEKPELHISPGQPDKVPFEVFTF